MVQIVPAFGSNVGGQKTEPDKNTYLVLKVSTGADPNYDYGTHFLFQGHEVGATFHGHGYITRINLDADGAHRVTLLAAMAVDGHPIAVDRRLDLGSVRAAAHLHDRELAAPTYPATLGFPSVEDISGAIGRGGYEGVQNDSDGNVWIVEDIGGSNKPGATAKQPNSFVYRFVPTAQGASHKASCRPCRCCTAPARRSRSSADGGIAPDQVDLHTYGTSSIRTG